MKRKLICFLFATIAFHALEYGSVWADSRPSNVNVTVPANIQAVFNEDGSNSISEYSVNNQSLVPIHINNINSTEKNGWSLVPSGEKILKDQKKISLSINNNSILSGGNEVNIGIQEESNTPLSIDIGRGAFSSDISGSAFDLSFRYQVGQKDFNLVFNSNGGDEIGTQVHKNGDVITLPTPSRQGWTFTGWTDSKGVIHNAGDSFTVPIGGETFTANWIENTSTLISGKEFNNVINRLRSESSEIITSVVFTKEAIPGGKIDGAKLVSIDDSNFQSYAYLDGTTIKVSPKREGDRLVANSNSEGMFHRQSFLTNIRFDNFDTSSVTTMRDFFRNCSSLSSIDLSSFNVSNVEDMNAMFNSCSSLTSLDLSKFVTTNLTNIGGMFDGCRNIRELNLSNFDTTKVVRMVYTFNECTSLETLDVSTWDTSKVNNMDGMFRYCSSLTSLDLSHFRTSSVADMNRMFEGCKSLVSLNVSNWDTSSVSSMLDLFKLCSGLNEIIGINNFNTSKVTTMQNMFYQCSSLNELDLSNWDTRSVTNMSSMFGNCSNLTSINLSNWNTSNVSYMDNMFHRCSSLTSLDLSNFDVSKVRSMSSMFNSSGSLVSLNLSNWDTRSLDNMNYMFYNCISLTDITGIDSFRTDLVSHMSYLFYGTKVTYLNLSSWNTSKVKNMNNMFFGCSELSSLNISNWNTSNVTNMDGMFSDCEKLTIIAGLGGFETKNVTNMSSMFRNCYSLSSIDVSKFNTSNVVYMSAMFAGCRSLTSLDMSNWDTSKNESMNSLFSSCSSLSSLDVSNFKTSKVKNMGGMFNGIRLAKIKGIEHLDTSSLIYIQQMFYGCSNLSGEITIGSNSIVDAGFYSTFAGASTEPNSRFVVKYTNEETEKMAKKLVGTKSNNSNVYLYEPEGALIDGEAFNKLIPNDATSITFSNQSIPNEKLKGAKLVSVPNSFEEVYLWKNDSTESLASRLGKFLTGKSGDTNRYYVSPKNKGVTIYGNSSLHNMFRGKNKLIEIHFENFNTSKVTDMRNVFYDCKALKSLDLSDWDTSNVTNMGGMFVGCLFNSIDLSNFNTNKVTNMSSMFSWCDNLVRIDGIGSWNTDSLYDIRNMFYLCQSLTSLDLSGWNVSNVVNSDDTFYSCNKLTSLNLSDWDVSKLETASNMFNNCKVLTSLDLTNWNPSSLINANWMFANCNKLTSLDLTNWNTSNLKNASGMFVSCSSIDSLDLSSWNTEKVTNFASMFSGCQSLARIEGLNRFKTSNATDMGGMFSECYKLSEIDLSSFDTSNVTNMGAMFNNCRAITSLDVSNFNTSKVSSISGMFQGCMKLKSLDLSNFDVSKVTTMYFTFHGSNSLSSVTGLSNWNTSNVTNIAGLFSGCSSLLSVDLTRWNTENVKNMASMFSGCGKLSSIDVSSFNTANVTDMGGMFSSCSSLTSLNLSNFDTSNVTNMGGMFYGCYGINNLDVSSFNTEKVTSMNTMFYSVATPNLDLSHFNTSKVSNFGMMFYGSRIKNLNVSSFDFSSARDLNYMFQNAGNLVSEITINNPNLNANSIATFAGTSITPNSRFVVKYTNEDAKRMAEKLVATKSHNSNVFLYQSEGKLVGGSEFNSKLPSDATSITFSNEVIPSEKVEDAILVSTEDSFEKLYLWKEDVSNSLASKITRWVNGRSGDVHRYKVSATKPNIIMYASEDCSSMFNDREKIISINFENFNTSKTNNMSRMFNGCTKLVNVEGITNFNTSNVTNMESMFCNGSSLTSLNLAGWNTGNVTSMSQMFNYCSQLEDLKLTGWDTSNVTIMYGMFGRLSNIKVLDVSSFNTGNVTDMRYMFDYGYKLENIIGVESFNMSQVKTTANMFDRCYKIKSLDLSRWDTSMVDNMSCMFLDCLDLVEIKGLSSLNTSKVTNMTEMFKGCRSMTSVDLTGWDTSSVNNMTEMFSGCNKLSEVNGLSSLNVSNVTSLAKMFLECSSLTSVDLSSWNTSNVTTVEGMFMRSVKLSSVNISNWSNENLTTVLNMFEGCSSLSSVNLENFRTPNVIVMRGMFYGCGSLESLDVSSFDTSKVENMDGTFGYSPRLTKVIGLDKLNTSSLRITVNMFERSESLSGEMTIMNPNMLHYDNMFKNAFTNSGSKFIVKYAEGCEEMAKRLMSTKSENSNVYLYEDYSITYELNGGKFDDSLEVPRTYKIDSESITLPTPSREGYTFDGWSSSDEFTGDAIINIPSGSVGNKTFYAKWAPNKYDVKFDKGYLAGENLYEDVYDTSRWIYNDSGIKDNNGLVVLDDPSVPGGKVNEFTVLEPVKNSTYTGPYYNTNSSERLVPGKTYTWSVNVKADRECNLVSFGSEQNGYLTFRSELKVGTEWQNYKHTFVASNNTNDAFVLYFSSEQFPVGSKLYVNDLQLIEGDATSVTVESKDYDSAVGNLSTPIREGYEFLGWFDKPIGGNKIEESSRVPLNGATYYAHWKPNTYDITFNDNYTNGVNLATHSYDLGYWRFNSTIDIGKSSVSIVDDNTLDTGKFIEVNLGPAIGNSHLGLLYSGLPISLENGKTYTWSINIKASKPGVLSHLGHEQSGTLTNVNVGTEWDTITHTFVADTSYSHRAFVVYYNKGSFDEGDKIYLSNLSLIEGSPSVKKVSKDYNGLVGELPTPSRVGYSFLGWNDRIVYGNRISNTSKVPLNGDTYYAQWTPNNNTQYVVRHHQMELDGSTYKLVDTENKTGITNNVLILSDLKKNYDGFTYENGKINDVISNVTNILPDGTRVVDLYYSRNKYYLNLNGFVNGIGYSSLNGAATADIYVNGELMKSGVTDYYVLHYYGSTFEVKNIQVRDGYAYKGVFVENWTYADDVTGTISNSEKRIGLNFVSISEINYNLNGGSVSGNPSSYSYDSEPITLKNPTKAGHTFTGWSESITPSRWLDGFVHLGNGTIVDNKTSVWRDSVYTDFIKVEAGKTYTVDGFGGQVHSNLRIRAYDNSLNYLGCIGVGGLYCSNGSFDPSASYTPSKDGYIRLMLCDPSTKDGTKINVSGVSNPATIPIGSTGNRTYTANWRLNKLIVKYHMNGGKLADVHASNVSSNGDFVTVNSSTTISSFIYGGVTSDTGLRDFDYSQGINIERTGYHALSATAFNTEADGSGKSFDQHKVYNVSDLADLSNGDVELVLYVNWIPNSYVNELQYWIWGLKNGEGNNTPKNAFLVNSQKYNHSYGDKFVANSPDPSLTPNGFTLKNSFGTASMDGIWRDYDFGLEITQVDRNMLFECDYEPIDYKITYNLDGGINSDSNPSTYNVLYGVTLSNPTKAGCSFDGWYIGDTRVTGINEGLNANFDGGVDFYNKISSRTSGDITLTARWRPSTYTINFNGTYADSGSTTSMTVNYGETVNLSNNGFYKNAHKFTGWNTKSFGTGTAYSNQQEVSNLCSEDGGEITLYAQWEPSNVTFNFNPNNGGSTSTRSGVLGDMIEVEIPSKDGHTFKGWDRSAYYGLFGKYLRNNTFESGKTNGVKVYKYGYSYSESYGKFEIVESSSDNPTDSPYEGKITATDVFNFEGKNTYVGFCAEGGNKVGTSYVHTFKAKIPKGVKVETSYNPLGTGGKITWYTEQYGTGKWETYSYRADLGPNSSTWAIGYIYISAIDDSTISLPFSWNLAYSKIMEVTDVTTDPIFLLGIGNSDLTAQWRSNSETYYLDVQGVLDGVYENNIYQYGTFDMYINGSLVSENVDDYWVAHPYGTEYELKNVRALDGKTFVGTPVGSLKGTIGEGPCEVRLEFKSNDYTVNFNGNYANSGSMSSQAIKSGVDTNLSTNSFSKVGYSFGGWNTNEFGTGTSYSDGELINNLPLSDGESITLYAQWVPNKYTTIVDNSIHETDFMGRAYHLSKKGGYKAVARIKNEGSNALFGRFLTSNHLSTPDVYNNHHNGTVTIESVSNSGLNYPYSGKNVFKITSLGDAYPGHGGFIDFTQSEPGKSYIHMFYAKLPKGTVLGIHSNAVGNGSKFEWLTTQFGTGDWQWYAYKLVCGTTGDFHTFGHVTVNDTDEANRPSKSNPLVWYLGHHTVLDVTDQNSADNDAVINLGTNDVITTQWAPISALSEEVNTSVNEESVAPSEIIIDENVSTETNSTESNSTESNVEEVENNDSSNPSTSEENIVDSNN